VASTREPRPATQYTPTSLSILAGSAFDVEVEFSCPILAATSVFALRIKQRGLLEIPGMSRVLLRTQQCSQVRSKRQGRQGNFTLLPCFPSAVL
jgi:hypothetical protein